MPMYAPQDAAVFSEGTHPVGEGACRIYNIFALCSHKCGLISISRYVLIPISPSLKMLGPWCTRVLFNLFYLVRLFYLVGLATLSLSSLKTLRTLKTLSPLLTTLYSILTTHYLINGFLYFC